MCGINAVFAYRPEAPAIDRGELLSTRDAMERRGPDGAGAWIDAGGRIGLGHRRLAIIDLSEAAAQPMELDGIRITYNGEIYNYRALRGELEAQGQVFRTQSDTEVLLHLYRRDGEAMVERLRGMYAFAIWDAARRGLFLARDPFGIKPLYYADDGRTLRAASQVKALRAGGRAGNGADPAGHVGFFLFGYVPEPHTLYADVRALPAGCSLWLDENGNRRLKRHFDPAGVLAAAEEAAPDLAALLRDGVAHHLVADVPVGVFLSAGVDSAVLTALAAEGRDAAGLDTLTLAFEEYRGGPLDEAPLAEAVAATYGTRHRTRRVRGADFAADLDRLLAAMDQPSIDGANTYFVAKAAHGLGLKVALSGLGGDELFGGYDTFRQVPALVGALGGYPGMRLFGKGLRLVSAPVLRHFTSPKWAGLIEYGTRPGDAYLLRRGLYMPWELPRIVGPDMARAGWTALDPLTRLEACHAGIADPRRKVAALEACFYMQNQLLRDADWAGMAHSLEIRVPFVDAWLYRALAPVLLRPEGPDKRALAAVPAVPLPPAVAGRPKSGFFVPIRDWLQGDATAEHGLRGWARKVYGAFA